MDTQAQPTRERILEAALRLFSKKGFMGATTRQIAEEAGIAEVTLFRQFASKENLFEEVINAYSFLPALKELLPEVSALGYEEALTVIARRFLHSLSQRKDLVRIMHSEMHSYPQKINRIYHAFMDEMFRTLAAYFRGKQKEGTLREFDAETGARMFLGMFFSHFNAREFLRRKDYSKDDPEATVSEFVSIFVRGTII
jgi:AcrR family transcriptional regulator